MFVQLHFANIIFSRFAQDFHRDPQGGRNRRVERLCHEVCHNSILNKEWFDFYTESYPIPSEIPAMLYPSNASKSSNSPSTSECVTEKTLEPVNSIKML